MAPTAFSGGAALGGGGGAASATGFGAGWQALEKALPLLGVETGMNLLGSLLGPKPDAPRQSFMDVGKGTANQNWVNPVDQVGNTNHIATQLLQTLTQRAQNPVQLKVMGQTHTAPGSSPDLSNLISQILANGGGGVR